MIRALDAEKDGPGRMRYAMARQGLGSFSDGQSHHHLSRSGSSERSYGEGLKVRKKPKRGSS
jgi:hypothetical protein